MGIGPRPRQTEAPTADECTHIGLDVRNGTIALTVLRPGTTNVDECIDPDTSEAIRPTSPLPRSSACARRPNATDGSQDRSLWPARWPRRSPPGRATSAAPPKPGATRPCAVSRPPDTKVRRVAPPRPGHQNRRLPCPRVLVESPSAYQCRCHGTFRKVAARKSAHTAVVATAREVAGFVWGLSTGHKRPGLCEVATHLHACGRAPHPRPIIVTLCESLKRAPRGGQAPARAESRVEIPGYQHGRAPHPRAVFGTLKVGHLRVLR